MDQLMSTFAWAWGITTVTSAVLFPTKHHLHDTPASLIGASQAGTPGTSLLICASGKVSRSFSMWRPWRLFLHCVELKKPRPPRQVDLLWQCLVAFGRPSATGKKQVVWK